MIAKRSNRFLSRGNLNINIDVTMATEFSHTCLLKIYIFTKINFVPIFIH